MLISVSMVRIDLTKSVKKDFSKVEFGHVGA